MYRLLKRLRKPIYFFSFILLLTAIIIFFNSKEIEINIDLNIKKDSLSSVYLKVPEINNDSVKLKTSEIDYFLNEWQKKEFSGFWKGFPEYQIILNYKNGLTKKMRINAKNRKVSENEYVYELKGYAFFENILRNKYFPNEPNTLEEIGIKFKKQ